MFVQKRLQLPFHCPPYQPLCPLSYQFAQLIPKRWTPNVAIHASATAHKALVSASSLAEVRRDAQRAVAGFGPLANGPRLEALAKFAALTYTGGPASASTLAWFDAQAVAAVAAQPENWLVRVAAAWFYAAAAETDPLRVADAERHARRALALAPRPAGALSLLPQPSTPAAFRVEARPPDALRLSWARSPAALTYVVEQKADDGAWAAIHHGAVRERTVAAAAVGEFAYRVRACAGAANCSAWSPTHTVRIKAPEEIAQ